MELLDCLTPSLIIDSLVDEVMKDNKDVKNKKQAKKLVLNSLMYNIVINQILEQVDFLLEKEIKPRN
jgi:hypothetical protein